MPPNVDVRKPIRHREPIVAKPLPVVEVNERYSRPKELASRGENAAVRDAQGRPVRIRVEVSAT